MKLAKLIELFGTLEIKLKQFNDDQFQKLHLKAGAINPWFTASNIKHAFQAIIPWLNNKTLEKWVSYYGFNDHTQKKNIGLIPAGNIPLVGFHDLLCILISGNKAIIKPSSKDPYLLPFICEMLIDIEPSFKTYITFSRHLTHIDAVIATGSDNTARYFKHHYSHIPHIIRRNRSSCAIIDQKRNIQEHHMLGDDIFLYFGLGCRNVSKLYISKNFDKDLLISYFKTHNNVIDTPSYAHNYQYQKALLTTEGNPFLDTEFLILSENTNLVSPIGVVYYEEYDNQEMLEELVKKNKNKIQCIVSDNGWFTNSIPFGSAQSPTLSEYADDIDTINFLTVL